MAVTTQDETILAGTRPPYVQSGMIITDRYASVVLRVERIVDTSAPAAVCVAADRSVFYLGCKDIRENYVLVKDFTPDMRECSICRGRHGDEVSHVCE